MIEICLLPRRNVRGLRARISDAVRGVNDHMVGIEIAPDAVRACWAHHKDDGINVVAFEEAPIPPETIVDDVIMNSHIVVTAVKDIRERLEAKGLPKQARASVGIYGHSVIIKKITLPLMTDAEFRESIPWEAEQFIPFDVNDVYIDAQVLTPDSKHRSEMEVLLVAVRKDKVDDCTAVVSEAGFVPVVVDANCFAMENAFTASHAPKLADGTAVLVNIGAGTINLNILSNGVTAFTRDISIGGDHYIEEVQKQLNISFDEASALVLQCCSGSPPGELVEVQEDICRTNDVIAGELQRSLDFFLATTVDARLGRVYLSGPYAEILDLAKNIAARTGIPVEIAKMATSVPTPGSSLSPSRFVIPYGLALRNPRKAKPCVGVPREKKAKEPKREGRRFWSRQAALRSDAEEKKRKALAERYRPSSKEIVQFCDLLALLLQSHSPVVGALEVLAEPDTVVGWNKQFRSGIAVMRARIEGGGSIADGMDEAFAGIPIVIAVVRVNDFKGTLDAALQRIADRYRAT